MAEEQIIPTFKKRTTSMILCYIVFITSYMSAQYYAVFRASDWSFILPIDKHIPFIEWMIIPYATSAPFFLFVFYWVDTTYQLQLLTKRMLLVSGVAFISFIAFPIAYSVERPQHTMGIFDLFYGFISTWDTHYNQAPSLHVAYAIIFMTVVEQSKRFSTIAKCILILWLSLVALSTLFVYQHHTIDVISAILVCLLVFYFTPNKEKALYLNIKKGLLYFILSTIFLFLIGISSNIYSCIFLIWITINLIYIGIAYICNDVYFIKNKKGIIFWWKYIILLPYITTYYILKQLNKTYYPVNVGELLPQVYIGPLISSRQASKLFKGKKIITYDLSAEMRENDYLITNSSYYFFPLLDIGQANKQYLNDIVNHINTSYQSIDENTILYIHCAMGLSRSMAVAALVYSHYEGCTKKEAQIHVRSINQNAIL